MIDDEGDELPYDFMDIQRQHTLDPTFKVPTMADLHAIRAGDYVRAVFQYKADPAAPPRCNQERMWVRVEHHDCRTGRIIGLLTQDPVCISWDALRWGDQVTMHEVNVLFINHQVPPRCLN